MGHRITDKSADIFTETKAISYDNPKNTDKSRGHHTFYHGRENVFSMDHTSIKKSQARRHQENQCRCNDDPCYIRATVFPGVGKISHRLNEHSYDRNSNKHKKWSNLFYCQISHKLCGFNYY